jgi:hypothetical protein
MMVCASVVACAWAAILAAGPQPAAAMPTAAIPTPAPLPVTAPPAAAILAAGPQPAAAMPAAAIPTPASQPVTAPPAAATLADAPQPAAAPPAAEQPAGEFKSLDQEVQGVKKDVIDLNKELFVLQEELLFPANTQVAVYVSMDVGTFFGLDSVTLKIDNREVKNYLYTAREADALLKGGVQELYLGNLKVGKHELVAFFTGKGPVERDYKRGATILFDKGVGAKYLELKITDRVTKHQPEFKIKDWE